MEFGTKIKMARNGIGLSTQEFSSLCGLSPAGLNKIERLEAKPNIRTIDKIEKVLTSMGWKLIDNGVIQEDKIVVIYNDYLDVLDDVYNTLSPGEEVLFHRADDRRSSAEVIAKMQEIEKKGIVVKSTICETNNYVTGQIDNYRQIDSQYFEETDEVEATYADRSMIHERTHTEEGEKHRYLVIKSEQLANTKRKDFYYWWRRGKCLTA